MVVDCKNCPLRRFDLFQSFSGDDLSFMQTFKAGELDVGPGTQLFIEGAPAAQLYTVLSGMGLRYKTLEDGSRQVVNFVMPGDFVGLQAGVMGEMRHAVEATTRMTLCVFNRADVWKIFQTSPERAFDLTYLAAVEEHLLGDALSRLGQHGAREKIAWSLYRVYSRALATERVSEDGSCVLPYRQQDLADALGLSLVHTNKSLARLRSEGAAKWSHGVLTVPNPERLAEIGLVERLDAEVRPLI